MKSKKVTMLAAALVVAVVAAAGIGYAVNYTATTSNDQNSIDSTYMTINQSGNEVAYSYNFFTGIKYNTENTSNGVNKYTPVYDAKVDGTSIVTEGTGLDLAKISKDLELTIDTTKSEDTSVTLDVTVTKFTPQEGMTYKMILTKNNAIVGSPVNYVNNKWTFSLDLTAGSATANVYKIALYVHCDNAIEITGAPSAAFNSAGFTNYSTEPAEVGSVFTFTVTADGTS